MKKYIENIRVSVKKHGYIPTSDVIRKAIDTICPDGECILDNKQAIVEEVVRLLSPQIELSSETQISPIAEVVLDGEKINVSDGDSISNIETSTDIDSLDFTPPSQTAEEELGIVLNTGEKHDLISSQALELGIELSEVEVVELATGIKDNFLDHECLIEEVVTAIVTYHDHRTDRLEQKIKDARTHIQNRRRQVNQTLVGEFGEMNNFFRQGEAKRRELSRTIAEVFKT